MQNTIKEELQQLIPANLVSSSEELSDAELESVAGGLTVTTNTRVTLRVGGNIVFDATALRGSSYCRVYSYVESI